MHCRQCCQVHWHLSLVGQCPSARHSSSAAAKTWSSSSLPVHVAQGPLPRVQCSAVDARFNNTLVALQASLRCANRGPPVEMLSNRLQTWYCCQRRSRAPATLLVSRVPGFDHRGDAPCECTPAKSLVRLPKEHEEKGYCTKSSIARG